jgi:hypothetical protein
MGWRIWETPEPGSTAVRTGLVLLLGLGVVGCTSNTPWRTESPIACPGTGCDRTFIEQYEGFDLAYVEFTERGNLFDHARMERVLDYVHDRATSPEGVLAVVFVHGWKHNAAAGDPNVDSFRGLLEGAAKAMKDKRRVVGIYVGWRGLSVEPEPVKEISYWDRKATAEQVGRRDVTELLLELERTVIDDDAPNKNLYLVVGHSFGAAIVLSALNEVFLERIVAAPPAKDCDAAARPNCACVETRPFGHGVVLLNPAIEANEAFQLKQAEGQRCFGENQVHLMHVISSDADEATNKAFRVGQWIDMLNWREAGLERQVNGRDVHFEESDLDTITVGNYRPFQTGQLCDSTIAPEARRPECRLDDGRPDRCVITATDRRWYYITYVHNEDCVPQDDRAEHIPVASHEPVAFVQTDQGFIKNHNDIFTPGVVAYLAAIVSEARFKRARAHSGSTEGEPFRPGCIAPEGWFDFGGCFQSYEALFGAGQ